MYFYGWNKSSRMSSEQAPPGRADMTPRNPSCNAPPSPAPIGTNRGGTGEWITKDNVQSVAPAEPARISHSRAPRNSTKIEPTEINTIEPKNKTGFVLRFERPPVSPEQKVDHNELSKSLRQTVAEMLRAFSGHVP